MVAVDALWPQFALLPTCVPSNGPFGLPPSPVRPTLPTRLLPSRRTAHTDTDDLPQRPTAHIARRHLGRTREVVVGEALRPVSAHTRDRTRLPLSAPSANSRAFRVREPAAMSCDNTPSALDERYFTATRHDYPRGPSATLRQQSRIIDLVLSIST